MAYLIAACVGSPVVLRAQVRATIDVGGASVRYGDSVRVTATTLAPTVRLDGGPLTTVASGSVSIVGGSAWSSQGGIAASVLSPSLGVGRIEIVGASGGTLHQDGTRTGQYLGRVRLHAAGVQRGIWLGAGTGSGWDGSVWHTSVEGDFGAWSQHHDVTVLGTLRPAAIGDSLRFTDLAAMVRREATRVELAASAGLRSGVASRRGSPNRWGGFSAALWVTPQLAVVVDGGTYPADFNQGFPGGSYLSLALRMASHGRVWTRRQPRPTTPSRARPAAATSNAHVDIIARGAGRYVLRVRAPGASRVEIMGDFTDWMPTELAASPNGWWSTVIRITPGVRQMNVRLDGGPWTVPAGANSQTDEFGDAVGVVIVR